MEKYTDKISGNQSGRIVVNDDVRAHKPCFITERLFKHSHNCDELHFNLTSIQLEYNNSLDYILNKVNDEQNDKLINMRLDDQMKNEFMKLYDAITENRGKCSVNRKRLSSPTLRSNCKIYVFNNIRITVSLLFIILGHAGIMFKIKMKFHCSGEAGISFFNCARMRLTLSFKSMLLNKPPLTLLKMLGAADTDHDESVVSHSSIAGVFQFQISRHDSLHRSFITHSHLALRYKLSLWCA
jgi:hypothetical protein